MMETFLNEKCLNEMRFCSFSPNLLFIFLQIIVSVLLLNSSNTLLTLNIYFLLLEFLFEFPL